MSIVFITGPSGCGKTVYMQELVINKAALAPGENHILLVPEQFNLQTQLDILNKSNTKGIWNIDILSFARLSHRIFDEAGGNNRHLLDDTAKTMILRRVATQNNDKLKNLAGKMNKTGYINELKSVISELLQYNIKPQELKELAEKNQDRPFLCNKLHDIGILYEGFSDFLSDRFITSETLLERAAALAPKAGFLKKSVIYLDGYTGFTPVQLKFLEEIQKYCREIYVTITLGRELLDKNGNILYSYMKSDKGKFLDETDLFYLGQKTACSLEKIARDQIVKNIVPNQAESIRLKGSADLTYLEKRLFRQNADPNCPGTVTGKDISIAELPDMRSEVIHICHYIEELVRFKGYRYRDIAVLAGSFSEYESFFVTELKKYDIPYFIDSRMDLQLNPCTQFIKAGLSLIYEGFTQAGVFKYLKSGMTDFTPEEVYELENYILLAGIKRKSAYQREWLYRPKGYEERENKPDKLELLNTLRVRFLNSLEPLTNGLYPKKRQKTKDCIGAFYSFIRINGIYKRLKERADAFRRTGDLIKAREYDGIYENIIKLIDRFMEILPEDMLSTEEFSEILLAGISEMSVGILPEGRDQLLIGDIERSRLSEIRVLILAGANDGCIPKDMQKSGILSDLDRQLLKQEDVELSPGTREQAFIQKFYLYMYLTKPSQKLMLTYSRLDGEGKSILPSYLIGELTGIFKNIKISRPNIRERMFTASEGFDRLSEKLSYPPDEETKKLMDYFKNTQEYGPRLLQLLDNSFRVHRDTPLSKAISRQLYGNEISGSVTRLERYAQCAYSHFLEYGLRLIPLKEYSFENSDLGNLYHEILEKYGLLLKKEGYSWADIPAEEVKSLTQRAVDECIGDIKYSALFESSRTSFMEKRIRSLMDCTTREITYQIQKGDFIPEGYEKSFGECIPLKDGDVSMRLHGSIDRIDLFREGEDIYVKVTDYKSGSKSLELSSVYNGISLQLMVYMYSALQLLKRDPSYKDKRVHNAGVVYYHISDPLIKVENTEIASFSDQILEQKRHEKLMQRGVFIDDEELLGHMDREFGSKLKSDIMNARYTKNGKPASGTTLISESDFEAVAAFTKKKLIEFAGEIADGNINVNPALQLLSDEEPKGCSLCNFKHICNFSAEEEGFECRSYRQLSNEEALENMKKELNSEKDGN